MSESRDEFVPFHAACVVAKAEDGQLFVGFADHEFETTRYLTLVRASPTGDRPDDEDSETYYIEHDDQLHSSYDGVEAAVLRPDGLAITMTDDGASEIGWKSLGVTFDREAAPATLGESLRAIFRGTTILREESGEGS